MNKATLSAGSKVEYSSTENGTYTKINGLLSIPQIGDTPEKVPTTSLDNLKYETSINGLMPAPEMAFEFNMEHPQAGANINLVDALANGSVYYWKITNSNGIVHSYKSDVTYSFNETAVGDIFKFTMYHAPQEEITTTIPTSSL